MVPRLFRVFLLAYPPSLRRSFGAEMADALEQQWQRRGTLMSRLRLASDLASDAAASWRGKRPPFMPNMRNTSSDLRDAFRLFRRAPAFAVGAVITLALGIGASTAIFSLADAALLRPLAIPGAGRVVQTTFSWSYQDFRDIAAQQTMFSSVAAWAYPPFGVEHGDGTLQVTGAGISGDYFALAGQHPLIGRLLNAADDRLGSAPAVVLSERLWRREFGADPNLLGTPLLINRRPTTVVGVVPAAFRGLSLQIAPELYVSLTSLPDLATGFLASPGLLTNRGRVWLNWAGRLNDNANATAAEQQVRQIYGRARSAATAKDRTDPTPWFMSVTDRATGASIRRGASTASELRRFVWILVASTALTLLLACATVANLLLVRAERRRREFSVRGALGAGRARLVRLLLVESLAIGLSGGIAGAGVAAFALKLLGTFALPGQISIEDLNLTLNAQLLIANTGLGLLTAVIFGLSPIWQLWRLDVAESLRGGHRSTTRQPLRTMLVAVQVALCVVLMSGSLAFGRAMQYALTADLGFNASDTIIVTINPAIARIPTARLNPFQEQALAKLRARPDVRAAAWAAIRPMSGMMMSSPVIDGYARAKDEDLSVQSNITSDGYFEALEIPIASGRAFNEQDTITAPRVAVISESMAKKYWPTGGAVGGRISQEDTGAADPKWISVIGIARDMHRAIGERAPTMLYLPAAQSIGPFAEMDYLIVRGPSLSAEDLRAALRSVDPTIPVTRVATMRSHVDATLMAHRLGLTLFLLFATLSILLTGLGLYAVVAAAVATRTREIGVRVALGASGSTIVRLVAQQGLFPVAAGVIVGLASAAASAKLIAGFMFSLPPLTLPTVVAIVAAVSLLAFLAMLVPARRALAVDPAITLRTE